MFIRGPEKPLAPFCRSIRAECGGRSAQAGGEGAGEWGRVLRMSLAHSQHGLNQLALGRLQLARE